MKKTLAILLATSSLLVTTAAAQSLDLEKEDLTLGFIKLTDMAPLAVAYELGYFEDEGLFVTLEAQANWKVLLDGVISGELDGAHMLAGQPLAATIGYGTEAHIITPFSMDLNGNAITVSNEIWDEMRPNVPLMDDGRPQHPISASALAPVVEGYQDAGNRSTWAWCSLSPPTITKSATGWPQAVCNPVFIASRISPVRSARMYCCP